MRHYKDTEEKWLKQVYKAQRNNSKLRNHPLPNYTLEELKDWVDTQDNFIELYRAYKGNGFSTKLVPSINREDDSKPYTLSNLKNIVTWEDNKREGELKRQKGLSKSTNKRVLMFDLDGNFIREFNSYHHVEKLGYATASHISSVCKCKRLTTNRLIFLDAEDFNEETLKDKIKRAKKAGVNTTNYNRETPNNAKPIVQLTLDTEEILKIYPSLNSASLETSIHKSAIDGNLYRNKTHGGGYKWLYLNDYLTKTIQEIDNKEPNLEVKQVKPSQVHYNEDTCLVTIKE